MSQDHLVTSSVDSQEHVSSKVFSSQDLYFTGGSRDSGVGQSVYQVLKIMWMWIYMLTKFTIYLKRSELLFIYQFKFLKSVLMEMMVWQFYQQYKWQYVLKSLSLFRMLAWIKYTKCLNEVLRWASSPRDTISWTIHKYCRNPNLNLQKDFCFSVGTLKCWW